MSTLGNNGLNERIHTNSAVILDVLAEHVEQSLELGTVQVKFFLTAFSCTKKITGKSFDE